MKDKYGDVICYCGDPAVVCDPNGDYCNRHRRDSLKYAMSDILAREHRARIEAWLVGNDPAELDAPH